MADFSAPPSLQNLVSGQQQALQALQAVQTALEKLQKPVVVSAPATATSPGDPGQFAWDIQYLYVCVAQNTWKRVSIETW